MTVISDDKKPRNEVTGLIVETEEDSQETASVDNNEAVSNQIFSDPTIVSTNEENDLIFPVEIMNRVIDMVNKTRWVVPVLPKGDLEKMLLVSIKFAFLKKDEEIEHFKELYKNGLLVSFEKILSDDAVLGWKLDILDSIYRNSIIMTKLCAMKMNDDNLCILEILAILFNPDVKYHHLSNNFPSPVTTRVNCLEDFTDLLKSCSETDVSGQVDTLDVEVAGLPIENESRYSHPNDNRRNKVIFSDLINCFGHFDGFTNLKLRFERFDRLDQPDIAANLTLLLALLKPLSLSIDHLKEYTVQEYVKPIAEKSVKLILALNDDAIKPEGMKEWKSDKFSSIIHFLEIIIRRSNSDEAYINHLNSFRLNIILKVLQHASFNGRMNALNELNKLIKNIYAFYPMHQNNDRFEHIITWIKNNEVLSIVLKENLHQPQYVEKVEKLIRFMVKTESLTNDDLDRLWDSQIGKHEAIVTNIHDLLAKLAYDFSPVQLQHLFDCFQKSWVKASKRQRERLIELIRRLAEEDKDGRMAKTALNLLWDLATQNDSPLDIMESALRAHAKILDFCSNQDRDLYRNDWLKRLIDYLSTANNQMNAVSTLRQIKEIIKLFQHTSFSTTTRSMIIQQLDKDHNLLQLITDNLLAYVVNYRQSQTDWESPEMSSSTTMTSSMQAGSSGGPDDKFPHETQIQERLDMLQFLLSEGALLLPGSLLTSIWDCLVLHHFYVGAERDQCFKWLAKLMELERSPFDPVNIQQFFEMHFLKLDPKLLTLNGIQLFQLFFRLINHTKGYLREPDPDRYEVLNRELVGLEYLWRCAMYCADEEIFNRILHLLKTIFTFLGGGLSDMRLAINTDFIQHCVQILQSAFDTAKCLQSQNLPVNGSDERCLDNYFEVSLEMEESVNKLANILQILCEVIRECDNRFNGQRLNPALCRLTNGHPRMISVSYNNSFGRNNSARHFDLETHSNELIHILRHQIEELLQEYARPDYFFELSKTNDVTIDIVDNYKTLDQLGICDGTIIQARLLSSFPNKLHSSRIEDASDEEVNLPGVQISQHTEYMELLISIGNLSLQINSAKLRWSVSQLLDLLPPDSTYKGQLVNAIQQETTSQLEEMLHQQSAMLTIYLTHILYSLLLPCHEGDNEDQSVILLKFLVRNNAVRVFLDMVRLDSPEYLEAFVPKQCEMSPGSGGSIRLSGLVRLLKVLYLLQAVLLRYRDRCDSNLVLTTGSGTRVSPGDSGAVFEDNRHVFTVPADTVRHKFNRLQKAGLIEVPHISWPGRSDIEAIMKLCWCCSLGNRVELMHADLRIKFSEVATAALQASSAAAAAQMQGSLFERSRSVSSFSSSSQPQQHPGLVRNTGGSPDIVLSSTVNTSPVAQTAVPAPSFQQTVTAAAASVDSLCNRPTLCALETLSLVLAASQDTSILDLIKEKYTKDFISSLLLYTRNVQIRAKAAEQIRFILRISDNSKALEHIIQMLFLKLHNVHENPVQYGEVYGLVVRLLGDLHGMRNQLSNTEPILKTQLDRLMEMESLSDNASSQAHANHEVLLVGRLKIVRELLRFFNHRQKLAFNANYKIIERLLGEFLFPSSKRYSEIKRFQLEQQVGSNVAMDNNNSSTAATGSQQHASAGGREFPAWATAPLRSPVCQSPDSQRAAYNLLKVLAAGCADNLAHLCDRLDCFFYNADSRFVLNEWDYKPSFITRSATGFVGLKNAGATCYMNSILQQLFMIVPIRHSLLAVDAGPPLARDDFDDNIIYSVRKEVGKKSPVDQKTIKLDILREVQMIFGNLAFSQNQFFTPTGFWKHFKFWGDEVNLREQHDALEFFTCLVDTLDEALHSIGMPKVFEEILVGHFADQKICKGCPHRYECEEKFFQLSLDIRNHENLIESLEQYVKGDLLEGDNAYYCESCRQKRDTVKRTCIKKLPLVLAIQLKRFDYDWERDASVKFNDYFEFPNELDMAPYTVAGTSRRDHLNSINELVHCDLATEEGEGEDSEELSGSSPGPAVDEPPGGEGGDTGECTRYQLKGVVVHGGQASGGHYYSYIRERRGTSSGPDKPQQSANGQQQGQHQSSEELPSPTAGGASTISPPGYEQQTPDNFCWYRFDDTEVTECRMDNEEMKNQWFGGDFMGESYDHMVKRISLRRQKRWWSAYILFYEREDFPDQSGSLGLQLQHRLAQDTAAAAAVVSRDTEQQQVSTAATRPPSGGLARLPRHIEQNITLQNIEYSHTKTQYTVEYFSFLRDLPTLVIPARDMLPVKSAILEQTQEELEKMRVHVASILSKFLFSIGFKTNRSIRGPAMDWFNNLKLVLEESDQARLKFSVNAIFSPLTKITEYLLESPNPEIRGVYVTMLRYLSHWSLRDPNPASAGYLYSDLPRHDPALRELHTFIKERYPVSGRLRLAHILFSIMHILLNKETNEHGAASNEYLSIFLDYPNMGFPELSHCLDVNLATHILKFCLDEYYPATPGTSRLDITKLVCTFCRMMRCYELGVTSSDLQIEMLVPNDGPLLQQLYPLLPPPVPPGADTRFCLLIDQRPVYRVRRVPEHLHKYLNQRAAKFIKKVVDEFYTDLTKDDFSPFLKYLCFDNAVCSVAIVETLSNELAQSFIRNIKLFMELFRTVVDIDDNLRVRRAITMVKSEQLDFAVRFKINSERRCYFIMKMILFAIGKLTEVQKKQMWQEMADANIVRDKIEKALTNLGQVLHIPDRKVTTVTRQFSSDYRHTNTGQVSGPATGDSGTVVMGSPPRAATSQTLTSSGPVCSFVNTAPVVAAPPTCFIESNEENSKNSIERTDSTEQMELIGQEMLRLYIEVCPPAPDRGSGGMGSEDGGDDSTTTTEEPDMEPSVRRLHHHRGGGGGGREHHRDSESSDPGTTGMVVELPAEKQSKPGMVMVTGGDADDPENDDEDEEDEEDDDEDGGYNGDSNDREHNP